MAKSSVDIWTLPVHPAAEVFPMLEDEELQELAADIAENGLHEPLVIGEVDGKKMLVDGRNRRRACELAKVEPTVRELNGEDPTAFVISANIHRRHLTVGQRAMSIAKIYPEAPPKRKADPALTSASGHQISRARISESRFILKVLPLKAAEVLAGRATLTEVYELAKAAQKESLNADSQKARLKTAAPDLWELVDAGKLPINEAAGAFITRQQKIEEEKHQKRLSLFSCLRDGLASLSAFSNGQYGELQEFFDPENTAHRADFDRFFPRAPDRLSLATLKEQTGDGLKAMKHFIAEVEKAFIKSEKSHG